MALLPLKAFKILETTRGLTKQEIMVCDLIIYGSLKESISNRFRSRHYSAEKPGRDISERPCMQGMGREMLLGNF